MPALFFIAVSQHYFLFQHLLLFQHSSIVFIPASKYYPHHVAGLQLFPLGSECIPQKFEKKALRLEG
jgi:hypothetical protein